MMPPSLNFIIPGRFTPDIEYRQLAQDLAWAAVGHQSKDQFREWPAEVVTIKLCAIGTMLDHVKARRFANMLKGTIYKTAALMRQIDHRADGEDPRIEVRIEKVE